MRVLNMPFIDPLDEGGHRGGAADPGDPRHRHRGGGHDQRRPGAAVASVVVTRHPVPVRILGIPRVFRPHGEHRVPPRPLRAHRRRHRRRGAQPWLHGDSAGPLVLAVDQGTSSTKAGCSSPPAARSSRARGECPVSESQPRARGGWSSRPRRSGRAYRRAVAEACVDTLGRLPDRRGRASAPSASRWCLWERDTAVRPLGPLLSWQDQRTAHGSATRCADDDADGAGAPDSAGLPLDPMFSALKARWLLDRYDPRPSAQPARRAVPRHGRLAGC